MLKRIVVGAAIAGASWLAYVGVRQWWKTWGVVPDEAARRAARRRAGPGRPGERHARDHDRGVARARLAVARADGLRAGRLVQHRPARHAREERRSDRRGMAGPGGRRHPADPSGWWLPGQAPRPEPGARPVRRSVDDAAADPSEGEELPAGLAASGSFLAADARVSSRRRGPSCWSRRPEPHAADRADALLGRAKERPLRGRPCRCWGSARS